MALKDQVQAVIDGILKGDILGTFETFYADDVVMVENGVSERLGKDENRKYEEAFVNGVDFHGADVGALAVDEDNGTAAVEWVFDMTPKGGDRVIQRQVAFQTWKDGKIVREAFYYNAG